MLTALELKQFTTRTLTLMLQDLQWGKQQQYRNDVIRRLNASMKLIQAELQRRATTPINTTMTATDELSKSRSDRLSNIW